MLNKLVLLNMFIHANIGLKNKYKWYNIQFSTKLRNLSINGNPGYNRCCAIFSFGIYVSCLAYLEIGHDLVPEL